MITMEKIKEIIAYLLRGEHAYRPSMQLFRRSQSMVDVILTFDIISIDLLKLARVNQVYDSIDIEEARYQETREGDFDEVIIKFPIAGNYDEIMKANNTISV